MRAPFARCAIEQRFDQERETSMRTLVRAPPDAVGESRMYFPSYGQRRNECSLQLRRSSVIISATSTTSSEMYGVICPVHEFIELMMIFLYEVSTSNLIRRQGPAKSLAEVILLHLIRIWVNPAITLYPIYSTLILISSLVYRADSQRSGG